jgi:6-phosphofructokinase 1
LAGGADVILIPEIPYDVEKIAESIRARTRQGKHFSIVAVAEGALSVADAEAFEVARKEKEQAETKEAKKEAKDRLIALDEAHEGNTLRLTEELEQRTGHESRLTILGHLQRGGTPSAADRVLATKLGTVCADLLHAGKFGVMVATRAEGVEPVPLREVAGNRKLVPLDHPWIRAAQAMGVSFGQ